MKTFESFFLVRKPLKTRVYENPCMKTFESFFLVKISSEETRRDI